MTDQIRHFEELKTEYKYYNEDDKNRYLSTVYGVERERLVLFFDMIRPYEQKHKKDVGDFNIIQIYDAVMMMGQPSFHYLEKLRQSLRDYQKWRLLEQGEETGKNTYGQLKVNDMKRYAYDSEYKKTLKDARYLPDFLQALRNYTDKFLLLAMSRDARIGMEDYRKIALITLEDIKVDKNRVVYSDGSIAAAPVMAQIAMNAIMESRYYDQNGNGAYRYKAGCPYLLKPRENASSDFSPESMYVLTKRRIERLLDLLGKTPEDLALAGIEMELRDNMALYHMNAAAFESHIKTVLMMIKKIGNDRELLSLFDSLWAELFVVYENKWAGMSKSKLTETLRDMSENGVELDEEEQIKMFQHGKFMRVVNSHGIKYTYVKLVKDLSAFYGNDW